MPTDTYNMLGGLWTVAGDVFIAALVIGLVLDRMGRRPEYFGWVGRNGTEIAFVTALVATFGSLYYSEIIGYPPCGLCWWQRVFMYPLVLVLGIAIWGKHHRAVPEALTLSGLGALVAANHYYLEMTGDSLLPCPANGAIPCTVRFVYEFGYVTIPLMALTSFLIIFFVMLIERRTGRGVR